MADGMPCSAHCHMLPRRRAEGISEILPLHPPTLLFFSYRSLSPSHLTAIAVLRTGSTCICCSWKDTRDDDVITAVTMASDTGSGTAGYNPTSLDFINRPNPVEPSALDPNLAFGSTHKLDKSANDDLLRVLLSADVRRPRRDAESARQSRSSGAQATAVPLALVLNGEDESSGTSEHHSTRRDLDQPIFRLPELPPKRGVKRARILPPTLQGLHQPPPDAGLLPSISAEGAQVLVKATRDKPTESASTTQPGITARDANSAAADADAASSRRVRRNKWSEEETACLLKGVARFGIGSWKKILNCPDYSFNKRTAIDLKDRYDC